MPGFPGLSRVTDRDVYNVLKILYDLVQQQKTRIDALERQALVRGATIDAGWQRLTNVGPATSTGDAVPLEQVQRLINAVKAASPY